VAWSSGGEWQKDCSRTFARCADIDPDEPTATLPFESEVFQHFTELAQGK
jgi:hypothetical protein